jgi:hypothetical protein
MGERRLRGRRKSSDRARRRLEAKNYDIIACITRVCLGLHLQYAFSMIVLTTQLSASWMSSGRRTVMPHGKTTNTSRELPLIPIGCVEIHPTLLHRSDRKPTPPIQISVAPSAPTASCPLITSTKCNSIPCSRARRHSSRSDGSRCLYASRRSGGADADDAGWRRARRVLIRAGKDAVLYVTSAALVNPDRNRGLATRGRDRVGWDVHDQIDT